MMRKIILPSGILLLALVLSACGQLGPAGGPPPTPTIDQAKLANPAAEYCQDQGFKYETRKDDQGNAYGVCIFDDGTECDAWAYFRGECGQGQAKNLVLNMVEAANLDETKEIAIVAVGEAQAQTVTTISDPETIRALVQPLNADLPLIPPKRCPASYELRFRLKGGEERTFSLGLCGLYGDQSYWKGMTINPPEEFVKTFNHLVASSK